MQEDRFVAYRLELAQLEHRLQRVLEGNGEVCFVVGETGTGKTALTREFARHAQGLHDELVVAIGTCDVNTGANDAYLPFREVLNQLTGNIEDPSGTRELGPENARRLKDLLRISGEIVLEHGPDLVGMFVPGGKLLSAMGTTAIKNTDWYRKLDKSEAASIRQGLNQNLIFEQYVNVLRTLSQRSPLLIILDDLHWADTASIDLLFRLCRRLEGCRLLLVCTHRLEEVAHGRAGERHPLDKVAVELQRYLGEIWIDLNHTMAMYGRLFIDEYLDSEPNRLGPEFRAALFDHTGGHPLFTVEILRHLQEQGTLRQDIEGRWVVASTLDWQGLPPRVEGVFEERLNRIAPDMRDALSVGSVEGEQFTAEIIAAVRSMETRELVRGLSGPLQKDHHIVVSQGVERRNGQRLSRYAFAHNLLQSYLYDRLDEVELSWLHEDVGRALETLYGDETDAIAVQLAHHFEQAQLVEKARHYLQLAGEAAAATFANAEAIAFFNRALALTPASDHQARFDLLLARERVLDLRGEREAQRRDLAALAPLAETLGGGALASRVALRQGWLALRTGERGRAIDAARGALSQLDDKDAATHRLRLDARALWGQALFQQSDFELASEQMTAMLALAREADDDSGVAQALDWLGTIAWSRRDYASATEYLEKALETAHAIDDRRREWAILNHLGLVEKAQRAFPRAADYYERSLNMAQSIGDRWGESLVLANLIEAYINVGEYDRALGVVDRALSTAREIDQPYSERNALINQGVVLYYIGDYERAATANEQALTINWTLGDLVNECVTLTNLAELALLRGQFDAALSRASEALAITQRAQGQYRWIEGTVLNHRGAALLGLDCFAEAKAVFSHALQLNQELGNMQAELEARVGLATVGRRSGSEDDLRVVRAHIDAILTALEQMPAGEAATLPLAIHLAAYEQLAANNDPRAQGVLAEAHAMLTARASRIQEPATRRAFLENVAAHRGIRARYDALTP